MMKDVLDLIYTFDEIVNEVSERMFFADLNKAGFNDRDKQLLTHSRTHKSYFDYCFFTFRSNQKGRYGCSPMIIDEEFPDLIMFYKLESTPHTFIEIELGTFYDTTQVIDSLEDVIALKVQDKILSFWSNSNMEEKAFYDFLDYHYYEYRGAPDTWVGFVTDLIDNLRCNLSRKLKIKNVFEEWKNRTVGELPLKQTVHKGQESKTSLDGLTQLQYALYYYYLQESGDYPRFGVDTTKEKGIEEIATRHGIGFKNFQIKYNDVSRPITGRKFRQEKFKDVTKVLQMLSDYPKAMDIARLDLDNLRNS